MREIQTGDKSITYFSEKFHEFYHSKSGAIDEAFQKYAIPSKICSVKKNSISILDICFGVGYNTLAGLVEGMKNPNIKNIYAVGIELDPDILAKVDRITEKIEHEEYPLIKKLISNGRVDTTFKKKHIFMELKISDARDAVKELCEKKSKFDYVFLDPFSPKKCPELWTLEFFQDISKIMKAKSILTTYSCARIVRDNLINSGFIVKDGPKVMRRGPSTIAIKK